MLLISPAPCVQALHPNPNLPAWAMALIEGVGDEVTLLFGSFLLILVLLLAWISTRTSEHQEHLFATSAGSSPSLATGSSHQDTPSTSSDSSTSASTSTNDSSVQAPSPAASPPNEPEKDGRQGGVGQEEAGGEGVRRRGEDSSSQRNMVVRLKFLNDTERTAQVQPQDTIGYIKR